MKRFPTSLLMVLCLVPACGNPSHPYSPGWRSPTPRPRDAMPGPLKTVRVATDAGRHPPDGRGAVVKGAPRGILVSVDGLGSNLLRQQLDQGKLPSLAALARAGASTLNARTDNDFTVTLPNHVSMLTGRPVSAVPSLPNTTHHGWTGNGDVEANMTLHNAGNPNLTYVPSVFDVLHDQGRSTCLYSGKSKFSLFANSYGWKYGAPDRVGPDNGRNKIDRVVIYDLNTDALIAAVEGDLAAGACDFAFIHLADGDAEGHASGWGSTGWFNTLDRVDRWVGRIAGFADPNRIEDPFFLVLTADHGGEGFDHEDSSSAANYTIPFYIVGQGVPPGVDLYALSGRSDPGVDRVPHASATPPVRNTDAANVMTHLLSLPPVPGALMHGLLR